MGRAGSYGQSQVPSIRQFEKDFPVPVPKLPISTINNHIYNNFNIINNFPCDFSPTVNSSRAVDKKKYQSSSNNTAVKKKVALTNRKDDYKSSNNNINNLMPRLIQKQEEAMKNKPVKQASESTSQQKTVFPANPKRTLKTTYSTKNLLISSTKINLKNFGKNELGSVPQTARQKVIPV